MHYDALPLKAFRRERTSLFAFLKLAISQLDPVFINFDGNSIDLEKALVVYGLDKSSQKLLDLTEMV